MHYKIHYQHPNRNFIDLELRIEGIETPEIELQLPAWRPGRYELQHFAKNIQRFEIFDTNEQPVFSQKITKDRWRVRTEGLAEIIIKYNYYAVQLDAGGSYLTDDLLYINFVNCCLYVEGRTDESYTVDLQVPDNYQIACGLRKENQMFFAENFYQLVDSPLLASPSLQHFTYTCSNSSALFHLWFYGKVQIDPQKTLSDFEAFTTAQIKLFGEYPAADFHFLFLILPYRYYHGVEHQNSTVIVLGTAADFEKYYETDFLGVSCHELFHIWNIIRIRPAEMMPYDFRQENYFRTGFVAEGLTTYYGDYLLVRSGVWTQEAYFEELNSLFQRHFENFGRFNLSLLDSSFDLWLDGYVAGIPNRKGSIYVEGAVSALILDLEIRKQSQNERSLDQVMQKLWEEYGKMGKGYTLGDYKSLIREVANSNMDDYVSECLEGKGNWEKRLQKALEWIGCQLVWEENPNEIEHLLGLRLADRTRQSPVLKITPDSPADSVLSWKDKVLFLEKNIEQENVVSFSFEIERLGETRKIQIESDGKNYLSLPKIQFLENRNTEQIANFAKWLGL